MLPLGQNALGESAVSRASTLCCPQSQEWTCLLLWPQCQHSLQLPLGAHPSGVQVVTKAHHPSSAVVTSAKDTCQLSLPALRPCFCRPPDGWKPRAFSVSVALGCLPLLKSETSCLGLCLATQGAVQRQETPRPGFPEDTSVGCAAHSN